MSRPELMWTFYGGRRSIDVTSVTLANNAAKTNDITVPAEKRWMIQTLKVTNPDNVQRSINFYLWKEAAKTNLVALLSYGSIAASGRLQWPGAAATADTMSSLPTPLVMDAGETIEIVWSAGGASAGGTDADGQVISYLEVDM